MPAYSSSFSSIEIPGGSGMDAIGTIAVSSARNPLDITQVGSANGYVLGGVLQGQIAADIYYNKADHTHLYSKLLDGQTTTFKFNINTQGTNTDFVSGTGLITGLDVIATSGDLVRGSLTMVTHGALTFNTTTGVSGANDI
jgi:hypothetical protein